MAPAYKRNKVWYISYQANGRRIRKRIGNSKKLAELALKDAEVKVAKNEHGFLLEEMKLNKFLKDFLNYSKIHHSPNTFKRYRIVIDHFKEHIGSSVEKKNLSQISSKMIDDYKIFRKNEWINPNGIPIESNKDKKSSSRKGACAKTINFEITVLRAIFNLAIEWGYLRDNPTKNVKRLKVIKSNKRRFLTDKDCK